ncbi:MAG TPA: hypothetical protein VI456_00100 [Polyangia bacterium]
MPIRSRPLLLITLAVALPLALATTCATAPNPNAGKYPPRARGCKIRVFHGPAPDVKEWDDLGVAHVDCYLDVGAVQCLQKLKMEACRMGGDLIYDVPKKPLRPTDQGMVYTGHVAHTKANADGGQDKDDEAGAGAGQDEPTFEKSGPVEPIAPIATPPADTSHPKDGGRG